MTRILLIKEPRFFYSYNDEKNFFRWLEGIPAIKTVTGYSKGLKVVVKTPIDDQDLRELLAVMSRYSLDLRSLKELLSEDNKSWFNDPTMPWHSAVFS
jgi:hypothetical protein